jgi:pilus assembly protein TadC
MTWSALLLAGAILVLPGPGVAGARLAELVGRTEKPSTVSVERLLPVFAAAALGVLGAMGAGWWLGPPMAVIAWLGARRLLARPDPPADPLRLAAGWDLLAACLRAGLPVPSAVRAIAGRLPGDAGLALRATAELLTLGAAPGDAWQPAAAHPSTAALARGARRTARSGTELAGVAHALATEVRTTASDAAEARAQRAGVLITGPLGLCFLPAFVLLGIAPVVVGLAGQLRLAG